MNGWRYRVLLALIFALAMWLHSMVMADVPNTDWGMLQFHGSAAAVDLLLLYGSPRFISGNLCDDVQALCLASMIANFIGWIAYTAYAPPIYYDTFMWGLSYVLWGRLLIMDTGDVSNVTPMGHYMVRRSHFLGA